MYAYGPRQDEGYLENASSLAPRKEHSRKVDHLPSGGLYFPVHVLNREFYGNHHHLPTAGPEDNRPEVRTIQHMTGYVCSSPGGIVPHFVVRIYEPYVRIPVDGFACSQELNDLADGPVDQLSMDEILELPLIKLCSGQLITRGSTLP